jgi:hypothetical protein
MCQAFLPVKSGIKAFCDATHRKIGVEQLCAEGGT